MIATHSRAGEILSVADSLGGGITMPVVYSMFPSVAPDILRRVVKKMCERGALRAVAISEFARRAYLTTRGVDGRASGVQRTLTEPGQRACVLPEKFLHNQIAGMLAFGLGQDGAIAEGEIWRGRARGAGGLVPDGIAEVGPSWRVEIEVEKMVNQSPARWSKKGGIADRIATTCRPDNSQPGVVTEVLVVAPVWLSKNHPDSEAELAALVGAVAAKNYQNREGAGWWFLDIDRLESDPVWHSVFPANCEPPNGQLLGLAARRQQYERAHQKRAALDAARKAKKRPAAAPETVTPRGTLSYEESVALARELGLEGDA
ncbi:MAG: hypothetical protein EPN36_12125 [Rhodanobacteraceae bacterium]|nr:MAG: hypothetical protein EPN36_12125 [Rhodanobacteraceae bacterium]